MTKVLAGLVSQKCTVYLHNIIIHGQELVIHLSNLVTIFDAFVTHAWHETLLNVNSSRSRSNSWVTGSPTMASKCRLINLKLRRIGPHFLIPRTHEAF